MPAGPQTRRLPAAFGAARTWHRLACGIEDAGFEIRDSTAFLTGQPAPGLMWINGTGFPKSLDAARAIDMHLCPLPGRHFMRQVPRDAQPGDHVCPESAEGTPWRGWGTAAKPAWEPIVVARKPLAGTMAQNILAYGTGALNINACRLDGSGDPGTGTGGSGEEPPPAGRWPLNVLLAHSAGCRELGTRQVRGDSRAGQERGQGPGGFGDVGAARGGTRPNGPLHGGETVPVFDCVPGCPVAELDQQSGLLKSGANRRGAARTSSGTPTVSSRASGNAWCTAAPTRAAHHGSSPFSGTSPRRVPPTGRGSPTVPHIARSSRSP